MSAAASNSAPPANGSPPRKVLLVEDHADTATVITLLLKKFGHTVSTAGTVAAGLAAFDGGSFDVVLSDLGLPDGSGIEIGRELQHRLPVIALSGYGTQSDLQESSDAGFKAHLVKPVSPAAVHSAVLEAVARPRAA